MRRFVLATAVLVAVTAPAYAGVVNPDISVVGQPFIRLTDDASDPTHKRPTLNLGEVEGVFDAYLNPYAHGTFILSIADGGVDVEEGYFQLLRGLPGSLEVKGGKYRVGFGKLNSQHYGQQHILPRRSGNSAQVAEGSPILLCTTMSGFRRLLVQREAESLHPRFDQEGRWS
jgi:hypothetical protein